MSADLFETDASDREEVIAMLVAKHKNEPEQFSQILLVSAWGIAIAISSFLFLYFGNWLDKMFNTTPTFMLGFFLLAVILGIGRLFQDAWITKDHKSKILQDHV